MKIYNIMFTSELAGDFGIFRSYKSFDEASKQVNFLENSRHDDDDSYYWVEPSELEGVDDEEKKPFYMRFGLGSRFG